MQVYFYAISLLVVSLTRDGDAAEEGEFVVGQEAALRGKQNLKVIFD